VGVWIRIVAVVALLAGVVAIERSVSPNHGTSQALATPAQSPSAANGVALPGFGAGFSVFVGEEAGDSDYAANVAALLDRLKGLNANSVALVYSVFQDGPNGSIVSSDSAKAPSDDALRLFIRAAHQRGMAVTLRPTLDEANLNSQNIWRGQITPSDVDEWFSTYGDLMVRYATLAQSEGVAAVSVGVEFESMEQYTAQWTTLISRVRAVYSGEVTYSYNFAVQNLGFADALDFIGVDAYYPLDVQDGATVDQITAAWQPAVSQLKDLEQKTGKPVALTEIGIRSQTNDFQEPWKGHDNQQADQQDQANYFRATCDVISTAQTSAAGASIHSQPDARSTEVEKVAEQTNLRLVGEPVVRDNIEWQAVRDDGSGTTGFARSSELTGVPIYSGTYIWYATIGSLTYDPSVDQDYTVFGKLAEPVIGQCYAARTGRA
jgi:hypothetical protein